MTRGSVRTRRSRASVPRRWLPDSYGFAAVVGSLLFIVSTFFVWNLCKVLCGNGEVGRKADYGPIDVELEETDSLLGQPAGAGPL